MDRRLVSGTVAALAAVLLATGGGTFAAFDDAADVPHNTAGAGVLLLDLSRADGATAAIGFTGLRPGDQATKRIWVATNDSSSTVPASVLATVRNLVDVAAPCSTSLGKAEGEIASGIEGCTVSGNTVSGTPEIGTASRLLEVSADYVQSAVDPDSCATQPAGGGALLTASSPGNLYTAANANDGRGTTTVLSGTDGRPITLVPGEGVCVAVSAQWPPDVTDAAHASPQHPVDNAAQGDSFTVDFRFALTQVQS